MCSNPVTGDVAGGMTCSKQIGGDSLRGPGQRIRTLILHVLCPPQQSYPRHHHPQNPPTIHCIFLKWNGIPSTNERKCPSSLFSYSHTLLNHLTKHCPSSLAPLNLLNKCFLHKSLYSHLPSPHLPNFMPLFSMLFLILLLLIVDPLHLAP